MMASSQKTVCELPSFAAVPTHADPTTYMICIRTRSTSPSSLRSPALLASTSATRCTASCLDKVGKTYSPAGWLETIAPLRLSLADVVLQVIWDTALPCSWRDAPPLAVE